MNTKFNALLAKAKEIESKTLFGEVGYQIMCHNSIMDYTKHLEEAKEIVKGYKEIMATGMWINPIVIDVNDGEVITEKDIEKHNILYSELYH